MKKILLLYTVFFGLCRMTDAQQLTRFAVVDLSKVHIAFFSESRAVRDFEERSARVQAEIDRMTAEIQNLRVSQMNAQAQGNMDQALRYENEIIRRSDFLKEYYRTQTAALERQKNALTQSSSFNEQVYDEIRFIAESEGYSAVLNLRDSNGLIWYSPTVDITDKVIESLRNRRR